MRRHHNSHWSSKRQNQINSSKVVVSYSLFPFFIPLQISFLSSFPLNIKEKNFVVRITAMEVSAAPQRLSGAWRSLPVNRRVKRRCLVISLIPAEMHHFCYSGQVPAILQHPWAVTPSRHYRRKRTILKPLMTDWFWWHIY